MLFHCQENSCPAPQPRVSSQLMEKKPLLTAKEVQEYLQISYQTLWRYMKNEGFPYFKLPGRLLFDLAAIDHWLEERTVPALYPPPRARRPSSKQVPDQDKKEKTKGRAKKPGSKAL